MNLWFFGHAAVGLESRHGPRLLFDPYRPGSLRGAIRYDPIDWRADYVVCSHDHVDHSAVEAAGGAEVVVEGRFGPFEVRRHSYAHDEYDGGRFGGEVDVLVVEVDGHRVVHLSDVGQSPEGSIPNDVVGADLACVPVGGFYTAGAAQGWEWVRRIRPSFALPIHYGTSGTTLDLTAAEPFLAYADEVVDLHGESLRLSELEGGSVPCVVAAEPVRAGFH